MLKDLERALKAAGDGTRLRILKMLEPGSLCVCQVVQALGLSQSTVSKHLSVLEDAGLVEGERRGRWIHYGLARPAGAEARRLLSLLKCCAAEDPQVGKDVARVQGEKIRGLTPCCPPRRSGNGRRP